jgi:hypothetical protein
MPAAAEHAARVYRDPEELAGFVADFLVEGLEAGDPALVVAVPDHRARISGALARRGWDRRRLGRTGLVTMVDADAGLEAVTDGDGVSVEIFKSLVRGLLDRVAIPGHRTRVFGELVHVLVERGRPDHAALLEELWNEVASERDFSLLCGYGLDVFDRETQVGTLADVCRSHEHVDPAEDPVRFGRAVDRALEEVLGPGEAGKVYLLVGEQIRRERVPVAQLALMWVSENMPALAGRILAAARANYLANAVSSSRA